MYVAKLQELLSPDAVDIREKMAKKISSLEAHLSVARDILNAIHNSESFDSRTRAVRLYELTDKLHEEINGWLSSTPIHRSRYEAKERVIEAAKDIVANGPAGLGTLRATLKALEDTK